jgi:membrane-associated phospholipid phosphatase
MRFCRALGAAALVLASSSKALAEEPRPLRYDTRVDVGVTAMGATWYLMSELLKASLVPEKCRWCYRADNGGDLLNPYDGWVRRRLIWQDTRSADITSTVLVGVLEPASQLGLTALAAQNEHALSDFPLDALIVTESTVVAGVLNQIVKFGFARERPFVHYLPRAPNAVRALTDSPSDDNLSFYSGHTTLAFTVATASGTVASLRGYRLAPVVWSTGLTLATTVGYLRIAADKHYFSDVVTAAIIGSIVGVGVPLVFHSPEHAATAAPGTTTQPLALPAVHTACSVSGRF